MTSSAFASKWLTSVENRYRFKVRNEEPDAAILSIALSQGQSIYGSAGVEFDVAISYEAPIVLDATDAAIVQERIERAREAAERVLQSGAVPLPADLEDAIAEVLEARRRLRDLQPRGTTMQAQLLRAELFAAVDALGTLFDDEEEVHA